MTIIIIIIIHVIKANNKELVAKKYKWPTNGYIDQSTALFGWKMADGQPLYCTLIVLLWFSIVCTTACFRTFLSTYHRPYSS